MGVEFASVHDVSEQGTESLIFAIVVGVPHVAVELHISLLFSAGKLSGYKVEVEPLSRMR